MRRETAAQLEARATMSIETQKRLGVIAFFLLGCPTLGLQSRPTELTRIQQIHNLPYAQSIAVYYDSLYTKRQDWLLRIGEAINELNREFQDYDVQFRPVSIALIEIPDSIYLQAELFERLSRQRRGAEIAILFSGKEFDYFTGKASFALSSMIIGTRNAYWEKKTLVHEMGHLFGLPHAKSSQYHNYMRSGQGDGTDYRFIPEYEEIIRIMRQRNFKEHYTREHLIQGRLPFLLTVYQRYQTDHTILATVGDSYFALSEYDSALTYYLNELDYLHGVAASPTDSTRDWFKQCYLDLSRTYRALGRLHDSESSLRQALSIVPACPQAYAELALTYVKLGDNQGCDAVSGRNPYYYWQAVEHAQKAIHLKADLVEAHLARGIALREYLANGIGHGELQRFQDAIDSIERALKIKPNSARAYFELGLTHVSRADQAMQTSRTDIRHQSLTFALQAFDRAINIEPDFSEAILGKGVAYRKLARLDEALDVFRTVIQIRPGCAQAYFELGRTHDRLTELHRKNKNRLSFDRNLEESIKAFQNAVSQKPQFADAQFALGLVHMIDVVREEYFQEVQDLIPAIYGSSDTDGLFLNHELRILGIDHLASTSQIESWRWQPVVSAFSAAIRESICVDNRQLALANLGLGVIHKTNKVWSPAIEAFHNAIRQGANYDIAQYLLGLTYYASGQEKPVNPVLFSDRTWPHFHEALQSFREAIQLKPDFPGASLALGRTLIEVRDFEAAWDTLKRVIKDSPESSRLFQYVPVRSIVDGTDENLMRGLAALKGMVHSYDKSILDHHYLGRLFHELPKWTLLESNDSGRRYALETAIDEFREVVSRKPDYPWTYYFLGLAYSDLGAWHAAVDALTTTVQLRTDFAEAHLLLGRIYMIVGDTGAARGQCQILGELNAELARDLCSRISR